jgi:hypothetical protein
MGDASRDIIKAYTPRQAANAIYNACQQAIFHFSSQH